MVTHAPSEPRRTWRTKLPVLIPSVGLLGAAMAGTVALVPALATGNQPSYPLLAGVGLAMIALSSVFVAFAQRLLGLGGAWLVLALITNALVIASQFILVPAALYQTTFLDLGPNGGVRSPDFFPALGIWMFAFDAVAIALAYAAHRRRAERPKSAAGATALGCAGLVGAGAAVAFVIVLVVLETGVLDISGTGQLAVAMAGLGVVLAAATMWQLARAAASMRGAAVLASVMWLAVAMVLVYHVVWVVFMGVLVSLWPLKVVAPSGK
jgi:hypothetical protein